MANTEKEMSFVDHLEELRMHLIRSLIAICAAGLFIFFATDVVFEHVIFAPVRKDFATYQLFCWLSQTLGMGDSMCYDPSNIKLVTLEMGEAFLLHLKVCIMGGLILAFPYILWEVWRFVRPGLHEHEQKATRGVVGVGSFLFILGVAFGYYIIAPFGINFLVGYKLPLVNDAGSLIKASSFINYMIMFTLPTGIIFELPILIYYLAKMGLITDEFMRTYRRHAIVVILIVAAIITPPDVMSQILIAVPVYILYELSIGIAARETRKRAAEED